MSTWTSRDIHGNERPMTSAGACPKCGSAKTWHVGRAMGGSVGTHACSSCNSYYMAEVTA